MITGRRNVKARGTLATCPHGTGAKAKMNFGDLWNRIVHDITLVMNSGTPPIYQQLLLVSAVFVLVKLYLFYKRHYRRAKVPSPALITNIYLVVVVVVMLGGVEFAMRVYGIYIKHIIRTYF